MKKVLSVFLVVLISFSMVTIAVAAAPMISISDVSGKKGDTVNVKIQISDNPGIISLRMFVSYDKDVLKLVKASNGDIFPETAATFGNDLTSNPYTLLWEDALSNQDYTENGTVAILTFEILETAPNGKTDIRVSLDDGSVFNSDLDEVKFGTADGFVNVSDGTQEPPKYNSPTIEVADVEAYTGDTISVPITIYNNPGIIALKISVDYDSNYLELVEATDNGLLGNGNSVFANDIDAKPYTMLWEDGLAAQNHTGNGALATLKFKILENISGSTKVTVKYEVDSTLDFDLNEVEFQMYDGTVLVGEKPMLIAKEGSSTKIKESHIYGLKPGMSQRDFEENYVEVKGNAQLEYSGPVATGVAVKLIDKSNNVVEAYSIIIFGDVNGDGWYDGQDAVTVSMIVNGMLTREQVGEDAWMAADCNHDGKIDQSDVDLLNQAGVLLARIDQTKSSEELLETSAEYNEYLNLIGQNSEIAGDNPEDPSEHLGFFGRLKILFKKIIEYIILFFKKVC